ncbi:ribonuclease activity regulator RraA [Mesorhizobium sp. CU2]|uniref:ribonuclease activity regulator RraA n=1 Tax=unclassified Mesorhizobium TaxID=325217 RepID=UPI00112E6504|nr:MULTISPECIES: ribonuclease activity regulator RraA [unclassified Mesorhizobium]TPN85649.1 ribonuclease activity regulator RraA [Mesorhizobium sp. CU3]TPO11006.1 ribonuclease activity regulator RraA [Mesorhizobium sp. CU2]
MSEIPLSDETRSKLLAVSVSTLTTVLFKRGLRSRLIEGALPIGGTGTRMIGPAFTLRFIPAREDLDTMAEYAKPTHVQRRAIEECPPGHVLVIDARGDAGAASAGDIMMGRLKARGCAGAVTDGGFRDTVDIAALGLPVYHTRPAPPSTPIRLHPADLNLPIGCGGVAVYPGDIVVGDGEGVVVIPRDIVDDVAAEAFEMTGYEEFAAAKVAEGRSIFGLFPGTPESRAEYEIWKKDR